MIAAGIVAEFDPFHNGHKYLIDCVRKDLSPDAVVVVMSGNFVQRGGPAFQDKYTRARNAVSCGADLVIELPCAYALSSAGGFARGAVRILKGLGCITHLAFGSECGDAALLQRASELASCESEELKERIRSFLSCGDSYPEAYEKAFSLTDPVFNGLFINAPNNVLAREYLKENRIQNAGLTPYTVLRSGAPHSSCDIHPGGISSAGAIRNAVRNHVDRAEYASAVPSSVLESIDADHFLHSEQLDRYFDLLRYAVVSRDTFRLGEILDVREGLENKLKTELIHSESLDDYIRRVKSKRFAYTTISRILSQIVLGITKETFASVESEPAYAHVLAFNSSGQKLLRSISATAGIPVYSNLNRQLHGTVGTSLQLDLKASDIYSILCGKTVYSGSDYVNIPHLQG